MTTADTNRRISRLATNKMFMNMKEDELAILLEDSLSVFLDYTHRSSDPGDVVDGLVCDIARYLSARRGAEGVRKAKDGEFEREWDANVGLPVEIVGRMKMYRRVVGLNATPKL